jgi:hypothetical protein
MKLEVRNPGPGTLANIHLEVDVADQYNEEDDTFSSGLIYVKGPRTAAECDWNGDRASFKVMPRVGTDCDVMYKGDCFSITFVSPTYDWKPKRAQAQVEGRQAIEALQEMPIAQRSVSAEWLVWIYFPAFLVFVGASVAIYFVTKTSWKRDVEQREKKLRAEADGNIDMVKYTYAEEAAEEMQAARLDQKALTTLGIQTRPEGGENHVQE